MSRIGSVVPAIARPCTTVASNGVAMIAAPGNAVFDSPTRNAATAPTANPVIVNTAGTVDRSMKFRRSHDAETSRDRGYGDRGWPPTSSSTPASPTRRGWTVTGPPSGPRFEGRDVKILVSTNEATTIEGTPAGERAVVLEFPDRDAALDWYHSDVYQEVVGMRLAATEGFAIVVDGR